MRAFLIILLVLIGNDPKEIAKINSLKKEAEQAYKSGNYELAVSKYTYLTDSMGVEDDQIKLNLGHAYYQLKDTTGAKLNYGRVGASTNKKLKSIAYQQLGVMSKEAGKLEESLQQLKSAIKADPTNREAIYDYEVVKKLLEEQKEQQQDQQDQDQQDQDQEKKDGEEENQEKQDQDKEGEEEQKDEQGENQEKSDQEKSDQEKKDQEQKEQEQKEGEQEEQEQDKSQEEMTKEKLEEMGISEEKARQLLEAMRQSEIKYLQNQKRKATKRPPSGKPDW